MPKFLCIRNCWDDCEAKGNHRMYNGGEVYTFAKGVEPPRHFVAVKQDDDGAIEVVGKIVPRKDATAKMEKQDLASVKAIIKKVTNKDLPEKTLSK